MTPARARKIKVAWLLLGVLFGVVIIYAVMNDAGTAAIVGIALASTIHTFVGLKWLEPRLDNCINGRNDDDNG